MTPATAEASAKCRRRREPEDEIVRTRGCGLADRDGWVVDRLRRPRAEPALGACRDPLASSERRPTHVFLAPTAYPNATTHRAPVDSSGLERHWQHDEGARVSHDHSPRRWQSPRRGWLGADRRRGAVCPRIGVMER